MMRLKLACLYCLIFSQLAAQRSNYLFIDREKLSLRENTIYIFCRGTSTKAGMIAHQFNIADTNITHVGIGYYHNGSCNIYHVADNAAPGKTALTIDTLESFIIPGEAYFFSVWEADNTATQFNAFKKSLKGMEKRKVIFDAFFNISKDDTLYCSEFCALVFEGLKQQKYSFRPRQLVLNNRLYETYLQRKVLVYYPVDFFESNKHFQRIYAASLKEGTLCKLQK